MTKFSDLVGKTLLGIVAAEKNSECIQFLVDDGSAYEMRHDQDCCENVQVEDICGDMADLLGTPIIGAEESSSGEWPSDVQARYTESFTWTFYRMMTAKGSVVIRWLGESNGYYGESVDFVQVRAPEKQVHTPEKSPKPQVVAKAQKRIIRRADDAN